MEQRLIFTIGHSTHTFDHFLALLAQHTIDCIIDVRSAPYSRIAPHFNKPVLRRNLKEVGISYAHFAEEFGARHTASRVLDNEGKVDFEKVRATEKFKHGIQRLKNGVDTGFRIALMCSEANPFDCHRFVMISYQLVRENFVVKHVLRDFSLLDNSDLEQMLLKKYQRHLPQNTLFEQDVTLETQIEAAYRLRNKDIAYSGKDTTCQEIEI